MKRKSYPDDVTDQEWEEIQDLATETTLHYQRKRNRKRHILVDADMGYRGKQLKDFMKIKGKDLEIVLRPRRCGWFTQEQIDQGDIPTMPSFTVL
jgi:transposase